MDVFGFTANWHSHTFRCKHAAGDVADYCAEAAKAGIKVLGISDHMPTRDGRWDRVRMDYASMPSYIEAIEKARREYPRLTLFKGLECEWCPEFGRGYYEDELKGKFGLDFIGAAPHSFKMDWGDEKWLNSFARGDWIDQKNWLVGYAKCVIDTVGTGLFNYLAHPDLIGCFCTKWTAEAEAASRAIVQAARDAHMPIEINTSGFRKPWVDDEDGTRRAQYPWKPFWQIAAEEGATAIIGTDAHSPELIGATVDKALDLVRDTGVKVIVPQSVAEMRV